jgi:uncharacterized DUF497 family protein
MGEFTGFEWDERKNERCRRERGFDFHFAIKIFETDVDQVEDKRTDYGETRFIATGQVQDRVLVVVWTPRGRIQRIISARRASKRERERFYGNRES